MALLPGIVRNLLEVEDNSTRFERVCTALYRDAEGIELVSTSRTWDLGRDARAISVKKGGKALPGVLCATLSADLDAKVRADVQRLAATTLTTSIVYCSSRALSEAACNRLEADIRKLYPSAVAVRVLGQVQLADLAERFEPTFRTHYSTEIGTIEQALLRPTDSPSPEAIGLRLALLTQVGDDAFALRAELGKRLVVDALLQDAPKNPGNLAVMISGQLHLPRTLSTNYISTLVTDLEREGLVSVTPRGISLTTAGVSFARRVPAEASSRLLEGRIAIRDAIKKLSGHSLTDDQYERVWRTVQEGLADLFYSQGTTILHMISTVIGGDVNVPLAEDRVVLETLGDRVASLFSNRDQGAEVRQALIDVFSEKESVAFRWLTQVCSVYVMMCSLGLEGLSQREISRALLGLRLVPDSDILLSLLCIRESNHEEVVRIVNGWRALGGRLLMASPVLEESAYHASISGYDYRAVRDQLAAMNDASANRLIANAFVRTYRKLFVEADRKLGWDRYIGAFRGDNERDYGRILEILREEYGFDRLPEASDEYRDLRDRIRRFLVDLISRSKERQSGSGRAPEHAAEPVDFRVLDKCSRDGVLMADIASARDAARRAGVGGTTIVVSSSLRLRQADEAFRDALGRPEAVMSTAAVACLLTLAPGVQMGLGTMRGVLFDLGVAERFSSIDMYAYRIIAASSQYEVPPAKRVTLQRELASRLLEDARARGKSVHELRERIFRSGNPEYSAKIVSDALDRMAVLPEVQKELDELRRQVHSLEAELEEERRRRRS